MEILELQISYRFTQCLCDLILYKLKAFCTITLLLIYQKWLVDLLFQILLYFSYTEKVKIFFECHHVYVLVQIKGIKIYRFLGMKGKVIVSSDIHIPLPGLVDMLLTQQREIKVADRIKATNQWVLKYQDYPGFSRWAQYNCKAS